MRRTTGETREGTAVEHLEVDPATVEVLEPAGPPAEPGPPDQGEYRLLPIGAIQISGRNTRKIDTKAEPLRDLAASIKAKGILEPVLVRPLPGGGSGPCKFELLAGERRVRAAKLAGLEEIPAIVRDLDEAGASTVTAVENLQREDLNPLEEAASIEKLVQAGMTQGQAARELGKSERWVRRRASLSRLAEAWKKEYFDPKSPVSKWTARHLELVARLPADVQEGVLKRFKRAYGWQDMATISAEGLERRFGDLTHALSMAPWKITDTELLPRAGACKACPKRSSVEPMLFDPGTSTSMGGRPQKGDRCLDAKCWKKKLKAGLAKREEELKAKHGELILLTCGMSRVKGSLMTYEVDSCKKVEKGAKPAMHVDGNQAGKLVWVRKHRNATGVASSKPRAPTLKELRKQLDHKRLADVLSQLDDSLDQCDWPLDDGEKIGAWDEMIVFLARLAATMGSDSELYASRRTWGRFSESARWSDKKLAQELWSTVRKAMYSSGLPQEYGIDSTDRPVLKQVAGLLGADYDDLWAEACLKHPEPAEWKQLKADGTPKPKPGAKAQAPVKNKKKPAARSKEPAKAEAKAKKKPK